MRKGLFTLTVVLLTLVGVVGYGAVPEIVYIPDVVIGDDGAATDNFFVFPDAFDFDDYVGWVSTGTVIGYTWLYTDATTDAITINDLLPADDSDVYAVDTAASFRNVACSPVGGPYTLHPTMTSTPVLCELTVRNYAFDFPSLFTVYTFDEEPDALIIPKFERVDVTSVTFDVDPGWAGVIGYTLTQAEYPPYGLRSPTGDWNSTTGCYYLETTGFDNDFGFWSMLDPDGSPTVAAQVLAGTLIPYELGQVYVAEASLYAIPEVPADAELFYGENVWRDFIPQIRIRINTANESLSTDMILPSNGDRITLGGGIQISEAELCVTTDPANPRMDTLVFDPRDQLSPSADYAALYFSFDLLDFSADDRAYYGELDEEGLVGLVNLDIDTFPVRALAPAFTTFTLVMTYPTGADYEADYDEYVHFQTGFGGREPQALLENGNLGLVSEDIDRGFALHELMASSAQVVPISEDNWYVYKFYVKPSTVDIPFLRLRVFLAEDATQRSIQYNVGGTYVPAGSFNGYQFVASPGKPMPIFNVFFVPPTGVEDTKSLAYAIDYIDFDPDHGDATVELTKVEVYEFPPPPHAAP